jgi:hypothetical protein
MAMWGRTDASCCNYWISPPIIDLFLTYGPDFYPRQALQEQSLIAVGFGTPLEGAFRADEAHLTPITRLKSVIYLHNSMVCIGPIPELIISSIFISSRIWFVTASADMSSQACAEVDWRKADRNPRSTLPSVCFCPRCQSIAASFRVKGGRSLGAGVDNDHGVRAQDHGIVFTLTPIVAGNVHGNSTFPLPHGYTAIFWWRILANAIFDVDCCRGCPERVG